MRPAPPALPRFAGLRDVCSARARGARGHGRRAGQRRAPMLLAELKTRLTAAPACAPHCAEITAANVKVEGDRLEVVMQVSALATVAVAMPHASDRWQLDEVSVDARGVARARRGVMTRRCGTAHARARTRFGSPAGSRPPNPCSSPFRSRRAPST